MAAILTFFSTNDAVAHQVRIFNDAGAQVGAVIAATTGAAGTYKYTAVVPAATAAGSYTYAGYRTSNGRLRAQGEFYWDGTGIVHPEELLVFIRDVLEADENYTPTKAQKLLKGTSTVLIDKDVASSTECTVFTTLIEAP